MMNIKLYWIAKYNDGSELRQFVENSTDRENKYIDIDRERLVKFVIVDKETNRIVYTLYLREGQRLIFRRRTLKRLGKPDVIVFLVGYQITIMTNSGPKDFTVINYIHEDGSISLDGVRGNLKLIREEL